MSSGSQLAAEWGSDSFYSLARLRRRTRFYSSTAEAEYTVARHW